MALGAGLRRSFGLALVLTGCVVGGPVPLGAPCERGSHVGDDIAGNCEGAALCVPNPDGVLVCQRECDYEETLPACPAGMRCEGSLPWDPRSLDAREACVPEGTQDRGAACAVPSDCRAGLTCSSSLIVHFHTCVPDCLGSHTCPDDLVCHGYECGPPCDPLDIATCNEYALCVYDACVWASDVDQCPSGFECELGRVCRQDVCYRPEDLP